jgi:hypothetical protein
MVFENRVLRRIFGSNGRLQKFNKEDFPICNHHIIFGR